MPLTSAPFADRFYMKIPEREMFIGQVWGTLIGPFVNFGMMRFIIDNIGADVLTGAKTSVNWLALQTRNYYSISVLWGVIGPKNFFGSGSLYHWLYCESMEERRSHVATAR